MAAAHEVQDLLEELHGLGYAARPPPALGTREAFDWTCDCLLWLCERVAPELNLTRQYGSEQRRVAFLTALGSQLFARTRLRIDLHSLYGAGKGALRELRRLAATLRAAADAPPPPGGLQAAAASLPQFDAAQLRELPARLAASGGALVAALEAAPASAAAVAAAQAGCADVGAARQQLESALAAARHRMAQLERAVAALGQEAAVLEGRVEKRHVELDRVERRLGALAVVRPAHCAQAAALEAELAGLYSRYLHSFRNLEYLEGQLERHSAARRAEAEEVDRQLRRIQRQVAADELRLLQGGDRPGTAADAAAGLLGSEDSEALLGGWGLQALPRLGAGLGGGGVGSPGVPGGSSAGGSGAAVQAKLAAAAALDLQLLPEEEEEGVGAGTPAASGRSRLSMGASEAGGPDSGMLGGRVTFGSATTIPAHRPSGASGAAQRPGSAARRTTGSGNALLKKAGAGGGGGADVLVLDGGSAAAAAPLGLYRTGPNDGPGDNDF